MTTFNIATHRGMFAKSVNPTQNEVLWWADIQARLLEYMLGSSDVVIGLSEPVDTSVLWYQPHATNAGNGTFKVYASGSWQALNASRLFTYLRLKAGYSPGGGGGGGLADGDYGDIVVADDGETMTIDANAVSNAKLADMAAWTFKMRAASDSGDPSNVNATALVADSSPAASRIMMTFEPTTGEPKKSTITQILANVAAVAQGSVGTYVIEAVDWSQPGGETWVAVGSSWPTAFYIDSGSVVPINYFRLWRRTA